MSSKENLRPLKILVFSMGLLLVGGTVLLFGIALKKMSGGEGACKGGSVDLKGRGPLLERELQDGVLRLTFEPVPGRSETVTVDACRGAVTGELVIETDPGAPQD
jgi:hypothetical protein